mmetsp:Transcript_40859/g.78038  ORF Transcript_40859/g.78038 Transcript_40859/m.78038 type:complete len:652 (+) Transcript_40859:143-2098(+)
MALIANFLKRAGAASPRILSASSGFLKSGNCVSELKASSSLLFGSTRLGVLQLTPIAARFKSAQPEASFDEYVSNESNKMFCMQCEQTTSARGCTTVGVCGKTPETSALQDLLVHSVKGLGSWAYTARRTVGYSDPEIDHFVNQAMFSTLTNVNFDEARFPEYLVACHGHQERLKAKIAEMGGPAHRGDAELWSTVPNPVDWNIMEAVNNDACVTNFMDLGTQVGVAQRFKVKKNPTITGLQELVTYGLKGVCAYMHHAEVLGKSDAQISQDIHQVLHFLTTNAADDPNALLTTSLQLGEINLRVLALLDSGHTTRYGVPTPTQVSRVPVKGKSVLISGHDMVDLEALLQQTEGKGVNVYTHGEMLPGHAYPELKKYPHLKGHYGGAWYKQKKDFHKFPGAILMTSNCILEPLSSYRANIFTTGEVGVSGVTHAPNRQFGPVVEAALAMPGFTGDEDFSKEAALPPFTVGFGHGTVLSVAGDVLDAVKAGKLEHVFLIGGCDGSEPTRKYYSNLGKMLPDNTMTLTLGCAKFRLLDQDWGNLPGTGLPRLLDMGQCNDSYGAVVVAQALADALGTDVNSLPLSLDISWFEQKAVAVLLTLLHLGVKNIRLGPRMPAFLTPEAVSILVEKFDIKPAQIGAPDTDMQQMMINK